MKKCVIVAYGRSAIGKAVKGSLAKINPIDFGAEVLKGVIDKVKNFPVDEVDDLILGCAIPEGKMGLNPARNLVLRAGLPFSIPGQTVNRFCSSGLQTVALGAAMIESGLQDIVIAGGLESMSEPVFSDNEEFLDTWLLDNTDCYMPMGITAENVAEKYGITKDEMEDFALRSHNLASDSISKGVFKPEIIPVMGMDKEGKTVLFDTDECVRNNASKEQLSGLKPCFKPEGVMTAGTSSQRSDGASFVILMSEDKAREHGIKPIAEFVSFAVTGLAPAYMGMGPVTATKKALAKAGLSVSDMDVIELNEAFASQALASIRELGLPLEKVNPRGGAIATGHPLGATGAILICKALNYLENNSEKYALITMCIGGGMGAAGVIKRID